VGEGDPRQPVISSVAATAGIRLALTALALVTSILTARYLGQAGRGDYFFMVTLSATIVQLTTFGLPQSNTYLVAGRHALLPSLTTNSAWVAIGAAGGAGTAIALGAHASGMLQDTPTSFLWLAAALAPPSLFYTLGSNLLLAAGLAGAGAGGFIGAAIAAWTVSAIGVAFLLLRGKVVSPRFDTSAFRRGLRFAFKAYVVTLLAFLVLRGNIFLLRREWGPNELGLYSIAAQVADVLFILPQTLNLLLFPRLVRGVESRWRLTLRSAAAIIVVMTALAAVTGVVARPVIGLLFGAEFEPAANVLYVMLPGVIMLATAGVFGAYLGSIGLPRTVIAVWACVLFVVVAGSLVLVPSRAGAGAAAAVSVGYGVLLVGLTALALRYHRRHPDDDTEGPPLPSDPEDLTPVGA
jgi:O-antigen/teichoic acid export membrane protein